MAYNTTPDSEDWDYFYFTNYPQPVRAMEQATEVLPYRIATFADISSSRNIHRCIGRKGNGLLADHCKRPLFHNIQTTPNATMKMVLNADSVWTEAGSLVRLARSCLCEECCTTQLSDVVVAWVDELDNLSEKTMHRADSVIDGEELGGVARIGEIAPVKSLVAASIATRDLVSKVWGYWS